MACDVSAQVKRKVEALSAYRSQLPLEPDMFPEFLLQEIFGREYFEVVPTGPAPPTATRASRNESSGSTHSPDVPSSEA